MKEEKQNVASMEDGDVAKRRTDADVLFLKHDFYGINIGIGTVLSLNYR